ncbi:MAG: cytochrome oxidase subunit, partial [Daejeonella sp.]|nr:cytochrome oxidase subunit [Daejeonella sp.]
GQTFKTLPFIIWIKHYQHLAGKGTIPMPADLYHKTMLKGQFTCFIIFNACFYAGLIFQYPILVKAGLACFLLTAILYMANVLVIIFHQTKSTEHAKS